MESNDIETEQALDDKYGDDKPEDARTTFQLLRGHNQNTKLTLPTPCNDTPPDNINVYTDGTLQHPHSQGFCLGAAAAW